MAYVTEIASVLAENLYRSSTRWEFLDLRLEQLLSSKDPQDRLHIECLKKYRQLNNNPLLENLFNAFIQALDQTLKAKFTGGYSISSRVKSMVRFMEKAENLAFENKNLPAAKRVADPFSRLTDTFACRIVIDGGIDQMYEVGNLLIPFLKENYGITPEKAQPLRNVNLDNDNSDFEITKLWQTNTILYCKCIPKTSDEELREKYLSDKITYPVIQIPKISGLTKENQLFFKDYVVHPKQNLYQRLHTSVHLPGTDFFIEIQLCTLDMDEYAELSECANHAVLRDAQNQALPHEKIDFSRVNIEGIKCPTLNPEVPYIDNHNLFSPKIGLSRDK